MKLTDLEAIANLAKDATHGKYSVHHPEVGDDGIERVLHGGWRTDSYIKIDQAFDALNERFYEEKNTPMAHRRDYGDNEKLIPEFSYRGPAQTAANARYLAALDPETILKLIALAKIGLEKQGEGK